MSYERIESAFRAAGYQLKNPRNEPEIGRGAVEGWSFYVDGFRVEVLSYSDRGEIAANFEYLKPDARSVMVESMNIAQSPGARRPIEKSHVGRRGIFLVYVRGPDKFKCARLTRLIDDA
jgi:hypothetical protein